MQEIINTEEFISVTQTVDHMFVDGENGVEKILQSKDTKIVVIIFKNRKCLMGVNTRGHFCSYYLLEHNQLVQPIKAVLMDLDGTTLYSEEFWIYVIEETMRQVIGNSEFSFDSSDIPFVSGHSVSEHLEYSINKYCPRADLNKAISMYYINSRRLLKDLIDGKLKGMQIQPAAYLKEFLDYLKSKGIKVGLVTSGLYEKAYPEIFSVCTKLNMGKPEDVYDSIITAGNALNPHQTGTLGELSVKPHPWLYLESALVGLGLSMDDRNSILGIEDSGAGICSLRLSGIPCIGLAHGNIVQSGLSSLCLEICKDLKEIKEKYFE